MNQRNMLIIAGGRFFGDQELFDLHVNSWFSEFDPDRNNTSILCGGATGADELGRRFAEENRIPYRMYHAEWQQYGKAAGRERNTRMGNNATHLLAFWDGKSPGTKHMIEVARARGLDVYLVRYVHKYNPNPPKQQPKTLF